jgi:hypothetical protein
MTWTLHFVNGKAKLDKDGLFIPTQTLYSGAGEGKNNPAMEHVPDVGPIPRGEWVISGPPQSTEKHGPYVLGIYPTNKTVTFGRSGFLIHGDSEEHPGNASKGCIITDRVTRTRLYQSGDSALTVTSEEEREGL